MQLDPSKVPTDAKQLQEFQAAQGQLSNALSRLLVVAENYPQLTATENFRGLQAQLESLPVSTNNIALFFNKDLFQKAGLNPNKPPTTWDQLRVDAKKIASLGNGIQGFEIYTQPGEGLTWQLQPYIWQEGGDFLVPYELYLEPQIDVRPSDKLIITVEVDGAQTATDFFVNHVFYSWEDSVGDDENSSTYQMVKAFQQPHTAASRRLEGRAAVA